MDSDPVRDAIDEDRDEHAREQEEQHIPGEPQEEQDESEKRDRSDNEVEIAPWIGAEVFGHVRRITSPSPS